MPTPSPLPPTPDRARWAGVPAGERRAARRALLLDAAYELLGTEGLGATTVRAVCQRARLNPRYFYESFPGLDDLVVAVYDRLVGELTAAVLAACDAAGDAPADQVRAVVETIVVFVDEDRRRGRVMYVEGLGNEALNLRRVVTGRTLVEAVEAHAAERRRRPPRNDPVGRMAAAILVGGFTELLVGWLAGRIDVSRERLVDDACGLFLAVGEAAGAIAAGRVRDRT